MSFISLKCFTLPQWHEDLRHFWGDLYKRCLSQRHVKPDSPWSLFMLVTSLDTHTSLSLHSCAMVVISLHRNRCRLFDYSLRLISILLTVRNLRSRSLAKRGETAAALTARVFAVWRSSGQNPTPPCVPSTLPRYRNVQLSAEAAGDFVVEHRWWKSSCVGAIRLVCAESVKKYDIKACLSLPKLVVMNNVENIWRERERGLKSSCGKGLKVF